MSAQVVHTLHHLGDNSEMFAYIRGGGAVMLPLLLLSAIMWMLVIERMVVFHRLEFRDISTADLLRCLRNQCRAQRTRYGLRSNLGNYIQTHKADGGITPRMLDEYYLKQIPGIERNIEAINILAMVCPLLGLLGTVSGMITTFDVIAAFGTGNARALAGGISQALITTQGGLLVSIPGMFAGAVLSMRARRLRARLEESVMTLKRIV
jgi:biopolymer transport protein ExbB